MRITHDTVSKLIVGIMVCVFFGVAAYLRIGPPYERIVVNGDIKFAGSDATYHMRLVDNLVHHFPRRIRFDPYISYPNGTSEMQVRAWPPLFDWLLGGLILIIGLGAPSQHIIDVTGAYFPAILGALVVIPVYFLGKELAGRWCGVMSAGLMAVLPGEFLGRSILGFTDHHVAEVLFSATAILFFVKSIKAARKVQLRLSKLKVRDWSDLWQPMFYSLLSGLFLAMYLLTWIGGLVLVAVFVFFFIIQSGIDRFRGVDITDLCMVGALSLVTAAVLSLLLLPQGYFGRIFLISLLCGVATPVVLAVLYSFTGNCRFRRTAYFVGLLGTSLIVILILNWVYPSLFSQIIADWKMALSLRKTILETHPLLFPYGRFSFLVAWQNYATGFFLALCGMVLLIRRVLKTGQAETTLFMVWSAVMLVLTLAQRRFAYYYSVNVALLTGYMLWRIIETFCLRKSISVPTTLEREKKVAEEFQAGQPERTWHAKYGVNIKTGLCILIIFLTVYFPNIRMAVAVAGHASFVPSEQWFRALNWLRENSPDPFDDPDFYNLCYTAPPSGQSYSYPQSAYGVMAWWDYGHWIVRIARRIPVSTPFQWGAGVAARFFTSQNESMADTIMGELKARYVIIDRELTLKTFYCAASFADRQENEFYDTYYLSMYGCLMPVTLFYPQYYRSIAVRLYMFDGKAVRSKKSMVIAYKEEPDINGTVRKVVTKSFSFPAFADADDFIRAQKAGNWKIVSDDPFISPVDLEGLANYTLWYTSAMQLEKQLLPEVKIFKYTPDSINQPGYTVMTGINVSESNGLIPIYRLYNHGTDEPTYEHLFTTYAMERDMLASKPSWQYERVAWYALMTQQGDAVPLYRLYFPASRQHHYTIDAHEYEECSKPGAGGFDQGVQYYVWATRGDGRVPVYRFCQAATLAHHFTKDEDELVRILSHEEWGWKYEGIAFYVYPNK